MNKIGFLVIGLSLTSALNAMSIARDKTKALFAAVEGNRLTEIKPLVAAGAKLEALSATLELTPLQHAAENGFTEMIKLLVELGANKEAHTEEGLTALHLAALAGQAKSVEVLLECGANSDARLAGNALASAVTVLHSAVCSANKDVVAVMLAHRDKHPLAYPKAPNFTSNTPLHVAAKKGYAEIVKLLLAAGENADAQTQDGSTPLHMAAAAGHGEVVNLLLAAEVNIDAQLADGPEKGSTPLQLACYNGKVPVVVILLAAGANIESQNAEGITSLHLAAFKGHVDVVRALLKAGANPDREILSAAPASNALLSAVKAGHHAVVNCLLEAGAHVTARMKLGPQKGFTGLQIAATHGDLFMCKLILNFLKMPLPLLFVALGEASDSTIRSLCLTKEMRDVVACCILKHNQPLLDMVHGSLENNHVLKAFFAQEVRGKNILPSISAGLANDHHVGNSDHWIDDVLLPFVQ